MRSFEFLVPSSRRVSWEVGRVVSPWRVGRWLRPRLQAAFPCVGRCSTGSSLQSVGCRFWAWYVVVGRVVGRKGGEMWLQGGGAPLLGVGSDDQAVERRFWVWERRWGRGKPLRGGGMDLLTSGAPPPGRGAAGWAPTVPHSFIRSFPRRWASREDSRFAASPRRAGRMGRRRETANWGQDDPCRRVVRAGAEVCRVKLLLRAGERCAAGGLPLQDRAHSGPARAKPAFLHKVVATSIIPATASSTV